MIIDITKNEPTCNCDGSIIIDVTVGNPPYFYSINNGITYTNLPLFTNLCGGLFSISVKDSTGNVKNSTVILKQPEIPTLYSIILNKSSKIVSNNGVSITKETDVTISVFPILPDFSYITFDLIHTNSSESSPISTASTVITNTLLTKNLSAITINTSGITTGSTYNSYPGCQNETNYISTYTEIWSNLQITNTDNFNLKTTTTQTQNVNVDCFYSDFIDSYNVTNLQIHNCSCCSIINSQ